MPLVALVFPTFAMDVIFLIFKELVSKNFDQRNMEKLENIFQKIFSSIPNAPFAIAEYATL